ncbi:hypothetical protein [Promicromonospora sp. NFX87]|uniref:hypothetical protein n=1 Tax=Promicromonospora sp. NFX87 TaxID=3402691 RepID=UPI003AFB5AE1
MTTDQTPVTPLTKRCVVLDLVSGHASALAGMSALYARPDDDAPEGAIALPLIYLTAADFRALGEREQITITIEPGDTLTIPAIPAIPDVPVLGHRAPCVDGSVCGGVHCPPAPVPVHELCGGEACETTGECQARSQCEYRTDEVGEADEVTCPNCGRDHIPDEGDSHTTCVECQDGSGDDE